MLITLLVFTHHQVTSFFAPLSQLPVPPFTRKAGHYQQHQVEECQDNCACYKVIIDCELEVLRLRRKCEAEEDLCEG